MVEGGGVSKVQGHRSCRKIDANEMGFGPEKHFRPIRCTMHGKDSLTGLH